MVQRDDINGNLLLLAKYPELAFYQAPKANSWMDSVALRHDREVPGPNYLGCHHGNSGACRNQMRSANENFIKGFTFGLSSGKIFKQKWNKITSDMFVGIAGTILFSLDNLRMNITNPGDLKRVGSREQYFGEQVNLFNESIDDAVIFGVGIRYLHGDGRKFSVIAGEIIRHEIERMVVNYISFEVNRACNSNQACMGWTWYFAVNNPTLFTF
jgi:hypothetical protein